MYTLSNLRALSVQELRSMYDNEEAEKKWLISQIRKEHAPKRTHTHTHPSYEIMVTKAIVDLNQRKGSSRYNIKRYILANYDMNEKVFNTQFNLQIRKLIEKGVLHQPLEGPNASFKITSEQKEKMKKREKPRKQARR